MKTKFFIIIFSLFLLIALAGAGVFFLTKEKNQPAANVERAELATSAPTIIAASAKAVATAPEKNTTPLAPLIRGEKKIEQPPIVSAPAEEKIKMAIIINGINYETEIKVGSSAYDLMNNLRQENKISFSGKNYAELGFFAEEINGVKNNPSGENWLYYVNGQPAQVGISNYIIKNNDIIEWKYENKNF
ncbi:MAG: DUF4430 domain-containing protein [bacterium]|nr:DUF4430 domain-containing protein [bacterium]